MWNDPKYTLAAARAHQRDIAREIDAVRGQPRTIVAFDELIAIWILALRATREYVRSARLV